MRMKVTYFRRLLDGLGLQQSQLKQKTKKKVLSMKYTDKFTCINHWKFLRYIWYDPNMSSGYKIILKKPHFGIEQDRPKQQR